MFRLRQVLDLEKAFDRLLWAFRVLSPDETALGFATGPETLSVFRTSQDFQKVRDFRVPAGTQILALHPGLELIAAASETALTMLDARGAVRAVARLDPSWGMPHSLAFNRAGDKIVLGSEFEPEDGTANRLHVLEAGTLALLGETFLEGESDSEHYLSWHPKEEILAVDVACGQDGTWLNFVSFAGGGCARLPQVPETSEIFGMLGFGEDGRSFLGAGETWIRHWSFPDCGLLAEHPLPPEHFSNYVASWFGDTVIAPIDREEGGPYLLLLDRVSFQERSRLELPAGVLSAFVYPHGVVVGHLADGLRVYKLEGA